MKNNTEFTIGYYNDETGQAYTTFREARRASTLARRPSIYRCWMRGKEVVEMCPLFIKDIRILSNEKADEIIADAIARKKTNKQ